MKTTLEEFYWDVLLKFEKMMANPLTTPVDCTCFSRWKYIAHFPNIFYFLGIRVVPSEGLHCFLLKKMTSFINYIMGV